MRSQFVVAVRRFGVNFFLLGLLQFLADGLRVSAGLWHLLNPERKIAHKKN